MKLQLLTTFARARFRIAAQLGLLVMSEEQTLASLHKALISFNKRAERSSADLLVATFVDSEPLLNLLSTSNNQVIYGRRGTGKTHALKFLSQRVSQQGDIAIYIDLRSVGSNGSIYGDATRSMAERASVLVIDVLTAIYDELYQVALVKIDEVLSPQEITVRLDDLANSISEIKVSGTIESEDRKGVSATSRSETNVKGAIKVTGAEVSGGIGSSESLFNQADHSTKRTGREVVHLNFGGVMSSLSGLLGILGAHRIWLLIDEWSEIPVDLQSLSGRSHKTYDIASSIGYYENCRHRASF
jgi:hypothetical protein